MYAKLLKESRIKMESLGIIKCLFVLILVLTHQTFMSQAVNSPKDIKSPNASGLGKYGEVPVSHNNGTIEVNIPLYSIESRNIPLDISLSYDSGGVMVNSVPGWVGQNWSLNAGGMITRSIKGNHDYYYHIYSWNGKNLVKKGFYYAGSKLNTPDWYSTNNLSNLAQEAANFQDHNSNMQMDLEPDIFTFNFMGRSGKFFLGNDGEYKVHSDSNLKIIISPSDLRTEAINNYHPFINDIGKITIIDDAGVKYIFGQSTSETEYSRDFFIPPTGIGYTHNTGYGMKPNT